MEERERAEISSLTSINQQPIPESTITQRREAISERDAGEEEEIIFSRLLALLKQGMDEVKRDLRREMGALRGASNQQGAHRLMRGM